MKKMLTVTPEKCVACRTCEIVCSFNKTGQCNPKESRIRVVAFDEEGFYAPTACFQCKEAWCAQTCPASAIVLNSESGALDVDEDKCVGCRMCTMVCPFGLVFISNSGGKSSKCDLCSGDPACVKFCPTEALKFEKIDGLQQGRRNLMVQNFMRAAPGKLKEDLP
jgi:anaerobic carbon-monoxide dehydrogenase iron sulfur subunit